MTDLDFLKRADVRHFIQQNLHEDLEKFLLNPPKAFKDGIQAIVEQLHSRRKAKGKLYEWVDNFELIFPPPLSIEQASSSETSAYKKSLLKGKHLIDLTGGMGVDCLAMSENFTFTTYVEQDAHLAQLFHHNANVLGQSIEVLNAPAEEVISRSWEGATFYIDPARRDKNKNRVNRLEDCTPNILHLVDQISEKGKVLLIKLSPLLDVSYLLRTIEHIKEVHVVSVRNDCKELLVLVDFTFHGTARIAAINLETPQPAFAFQIREEADANPTYSGLCKYLYEPNASILKAGAFNLVAKRFQLKKLSKNTHLYTADSINPSFPGKIFELVETAPKKRLGHYLEGNCINVMTRNYPLTPNQIKKKYGVKDGGLYYLIGFSDQSNKSQLIIAKRVDL